MVENRGKSEGGNQEKRDVDIDQLGIWRSLPPKVGLHMGADGFRLSASAPGPGRKLTFPE